MSPFSSPFVKVPACSCLVSCCNNFHLIVVLGIDGISTDSVRDEVKHLLLLLIGRNGWRHTNWK